MLVLLGQERVCDQRYAKRAVHITICKLDGLPDILVQRLHLLIEVDAELFVHRCIRTAAAMKKSESASEIVNSIEEPLCVEAGD